MTNMLEEGSKMLPKKSKTFWQSPGGKPGTLLSWGLLAGLGYGLFKIMPFVVDLLQNAVTATALGLGLFAMIYVIRDKQVHTIVWNMYKMIIRRIATAVVEYDPVAIAKNYIDYLRERRAYMADRMQYMRGVMNSTREAIEAQTQERTDSLMTVKAAQGKEGDEFRAAATLHARKAGRRAEFIGKLEKLMVKLETLYRVLNKLIMAADFTIEDLSDEVDLQSRQRKAVLAAYSAYQAGLDILRGDADKKAMFDQAMEYMIDDAATRVGEIDSFLEMSEGFLATIDLQNMAFEEGALAQLEDWERRLDQTMLLPAPEKQLLIEAANDPAQVLVPSLDNSVDREAVPVAARGAPDRFRKIFDQE
jgi:hypothetical protein